MFETGAAVAVAAGCAAAVSVTCWVGGVADAAGASPSSASITMITRPSDTVSPTATRSSVTVPATGAGTSSVALSDSSVTNGSSAATVSPAATWISITGMSEKSPMSGTVISCALIELLPGGRSGQRRRRSQQQPSVVFEQVTQVSGEAGGQRTVDDAVVVGQGKGQHVAGGELGAVPDGAQLGADDAEDGDFGGVDDGGEAGAADAAEAGDGERATGQVRRPELAVTGFGGGGHELSGQFHDALAVGVLDDRDHQAAGGVHGDADVVVVLEDEGVFLRGQ